MSVKPPDVPTKAFNPSPDRFRAWARLDNPELRAFRRTGSVRRSAGVGLGVLFRHRHPATVLWPAGVGGWIPRDEHQALFAVADGVVAGRYVEAERADGLAWRGSSNQHVHFLSDRYGPADMEEVAEVEFHLGTDGTLTVTGFPTAAGLPAG
jgi:hypothetical protein